MVLELLRLASPHNRVLIVSLEGEHQQALENGPDYRHSANSCIFWASHQDGANRRYSG